MKNVKFALLTAVVIAAMTACGQPTKVPAVQEEEAIQYVLDGKTISLAEVEKLEKQRGALYFLDHGDNKWSVYLTEAELDAVSLDNQISAQGCVGRNKTTIYDLNEYNGEAFKISKGASFADLSILSQSGGSHWNNRISSFKGACGAWTTFYKRKNFLGSLLRTKGKKDKYLSSTAAGNFSNNISSLKVSF